MTFVVRRTENHIDYYLQMDNSLTPNLETARTFKTVSAAEQVINYFFVNLYPFVIVTKPGTKLEAKAFEVDLSFHISMSVYLGSDEGILTVGDAEKIARNKAVEALEALDFTTDVSLRASKVKELTNND